MYNYSSGKVSSGKVSCGVFVIHLLLRVMCVLMHVHVLVGVNVSMIMCILVWIHVHVCVAPPIVVGAWPMAGTLWRLFEYYYSSSQRARMDHQPQQLQGPPGMQ